MNSRRRENFCAMNNDRNTCNKGKSHITVSQIVGEMQPGNERKHTEE